MLAREKAEARIRQAADGGFLAAVHAGDEHQFVRSLVGQRTQHISLDDRVYERVRRHCCRQRSASRDQKVRAMQ